jgi:hypothetical protein
MNEKVKAVNNPLTIIAIFAGLAEVAGTAAIAAVDKSLQATFIWFVMGFPILLVLLFFATLNFNPKVLYAPSDFKNEENFMNTVIGTHNVSISLEQMTEQLENAKQQIIQQALKEITTVGDQERNKLNQIVNMQLSGIELRLESVRREAESVANTASNVAYPQSNLQARILQYLIGTPEPQTREQIAEHLHMSLSATSRALDRLSERALVLRQTHGSNTVYCVTNLGLRVNA